MVSVSVRDVASLAGVSVGTVSNVLNRPDKVSAESVARVQAAIVDLGYVRNDAARQLRAGRSRSIGLVVLDVANPFFTDVARGAEDRAAEEHFTVLLGRPILGAAGDVREERVGHVEHDQADAAAPARSQLPGRVVAHVAEVRDRGLDARVGLG